MNPRTIPNTHRLMRMLKMMITRLFNLQRTSSLILLLAFLGQSQLTALADPILDKADALLKTGQADSATAIYKEYLRLHPKDVSTQLALATIAVRKFEFDKARKVLEITLAQHPDSAETAATLGRLFQQWANSPSGKVADNARNYLALAPEHLSQAMNMSPKNPLVLSYMADWQIQQDDLSAADKNLQQALQMNSAYIPALQAQTRLYMKAKDLGRAKEAALHALEIDPQNSTSHFLVAQLLALAAHPAEAAKAAEKSEQLDYGRLPERDYFLATQYEKLGYLPQAVQYYQKLIAYTPNEAQVWLKLAELYELQKNTQQSLQAYRQAIRLKPDILTKLVEQAYENTRNEKIQMALQQWRKLLLLEGDRQDTLNDAWSGMASLHFLQRFLHPDTPSPDVDSDMERLSQTAYDKTSPIRLMDQVKLVWASQGQTAAVKQQLQMLTQAPDPAVAGEAYFLLGDYAKSRAQWETIDGLSPEEYTLWADRLLLDQALSFAQVFYQRAYELSRNPALETAQKRIRAKQALATQRVNEGNALFQSKNYTGALAKYQEANQLYPEEDNAYLRLGDTYELLKQWPNAKAAYDKAIALSPSLMDSKGFAKNYQKLTKRAAEK